MGGYRDEGLHRPGREKGDGSLSWMDEGVPPLRGSVCAPISEM